MKKRGRLPEPEPACCPSCGQRLLVRLGVPLSPIKADLFDMVRNVTIGRGFVALDSLGWVLFSNKAKGNKTAASKLAASHICQLNEKLAGTDFRIENKGGKVRLVEVRLVEVDQ